MVLIFAAPRGICAQQSLGTPGLLHVSSAEMDTTGTIRIGVHYVDKHLVPDRMTIDGKKFNSFTNYLSITPFHWIEIGYGYTLWKFHRNKQPAAPVGFYAKDRYFSLRLCPLKEGRYWPSIVLGGNDVYGSGDAGTSASNYYKNYYIAATKHLTLGQSTLGLHLAYRHWKRDFNHKWNGAVGGLTFRPACCKPLRLVAEWDGCEANVGADCLLFRHFALQAMLQDLRYPSAGICYQLTLK